MSKTNRKNNNSVKKEDNSKKNLEDWLKDKELNLIAEVEAEYDEDADSSFYLKELEKTFNNFTLIKQKISNFSSTSELDENEFKTQVIQTYNNIFLNGDKNSGILLLNGTMPDWLNIDPELWNELNNKLDEMFTELFHRGYKGERGIYLTKVIGALFEKKDKNKLKNKKCIEILEKKGVTVKSEFIVVDDNKSSSLGKRKIDEDTF